MRNFATISDYTPVLKPAKGNKKNYIDNDKIMLEQKKEEIKELEAKKKALGEKGISLLPSDEKSLAKLYDIVKNMQERIERETMRLDITH